MNTQEVANRLVSLCREGKNFQAIEELYADNIVSIEPDGSQAPYTEGLDNVKAKEAGFFESVEEMHSSSVSDPIVSGDHFSCSMEMDLTFKGMGRMQMNEVAVYEVKDGKIVKENFFFNMN